MKLFFTIGFVFVVSAAVAIPIITGSGSTNVSVTQTYTYQSTYLLFDPHWDAGSSGTITATTQSGTTYTCSVYWTTAGTQTIALYNSDIVTAIATKQVTVIDPAPPTPATTFTTTYNCNGTTVVTRNTNPGGTVEWYWQTTSTGTSLTVGKLASITRTTSGNLYLRARLIASPNSWSASSQLVGNVAVYATPATPTASTPASVFPNGNGSVSVTAVSGADSYKWYSSLSGPSVLSGFTSTSLSFTNATQTTTYYASSLSGSCESTGRLGVTATVIGQPVIVVNGGAGPVIPHGGSSITLSTVESYTTYSWKDASSQVISTNPTCSVNQTGNYTVTVTRTGVGGTAPSAPLTVGTGFEANNMNYVVQSSLLRSVKDVTHLPVLPIDSVSQQVSYFDGLGRPIQSVGVQASPDKKDVVMPMVYDAFGREYRKYLPVVTNNYDGWYKAGIIGADGNYAGLALNFYNNSSDNIADDVPYSEITFEPSPFSRPIKKGSPGAAWQPDNVKTYSSTDRTVKSAYEYNSASEVLQWTFTPLPGSILYPFGTVSAGTAASPVYYPANELTRNKTKDEHQNEVIEFTDLLGRVVLKKVQAGASLYAETYYIYDDYNNLVCVIPPEATAKLATDFHQASATGVTKENFLKRWAFRYKYDARKRMTQKQVPGAGQVFLVYDNRNRLVLTQDSVQRTSSPILWSFTKYDNLNRPILTGIRDTTASLSQSAMQAVVNAHYLKAWARWGETYVGSAAGNLHGYSNLSYPLVTGPSATIVANNYLSVTYYDSYAFKMQLTDSSAYSYKTDELPGEQDATWSRRVTGLVAATKVKVMDGGVTGGSNWLLTINYYDEKHRPIQTVSDNYAGGLDRITSTYDFSGKILKSKQTQSAWRDRLGVTIMANKITRTAASSNWGTSGAASRHQLDGGGDGWLEVTVSEINKNRMIGLSDSNPNADYTGIDYALDLNSATLSIYENGVSKGSFGTYSAGQVLRIERVGTTIKYYKNGSLVYTSLTPSSTALIADAALFGASATLASIRTSFDNAVVRRFVYDHSGRLLKTYHKMGSQPEVLLVQNEYNALGQLADKKLHVVNNVPRQSVDYRYNIRGWLTSINNAELAVNGSNNESGDYFGMNLAYNEDLGTGNSNVNPALDLRQYNGNISAIKWSVNAGAGEFKTMAYNYGYDAMNRILSATHKQASTPGTWLTGQFDESGFSYDLNGNIKTLQRKGDTGVQIDNLVYGYGAAGATGNQLIYVEDQTSNATDKVKGFVDGHTGTTADYTYDANGNMTRDLNKGIGISTTDNTSRITYNFLNLPEMITKGGSSIQYIYDASGRKISQVTTFVGTNTKVTDYFGEFVYENEALQFVNHEEGRVVVDGTSMVYTNHGETSNEMTAVNATLALYTVGDEKYIKVTATAATARSGVFPVGGTFTVAEGERYKVRVKGYRTGSHAAYIEIKAGGADLGWPGASLPNSATTESWIEQVITIPASTTTLTVGVAWNNAISIGDLFYLNELEVSRLSAGVPEYQYHLKDHLGNVRLTFGTKRIQNSYVAGFEDASLSTESAVFNPSYGNAVKVNSALYNHTAGGSKSQRLSAANQNEIIGLAKSLKVDAGDTVDIEVFVKYTAPTATGTNIGSFILGSMASAFGVGPTSTGEALTAYGSLNTNSGILLTTGSGVVDTAPHAFVNYILFDKNYIFYEAGFAQIPSSALETGAGIAHVKLSLQAVPEKGGYAYIYVSNENSVVTDVYFDDMKITHTKTPIVQEQGYYPFGLTFNSYSRENSVANSRESSVPNTLHLFQDQEHIDDLGLNWDAFKWRNHQPDIGRFFNVDPLAEKYPYYTPYSFSGNEVTSAKELEGLEPLKLFPSQRAAAEDFGKLFNDNSIRDNREYGTKIYSMTSSAGGTQYSYAIPIVGSPAGLSSANMTSLTIPSGGTVTAYGHTHGASTASAPVVYDDNNFSGLPTSAAPGTGDVGFATAHGIDAYVATPNGSLQEYGVTTGVVTPLSSTMPSDSGPGTAAPGAGVSAPSTSTYRIQSGDTLNSIAKRYMTTVTAIQTQNGISDPNKIKAGATLNITN